MGTSRFLSRLPHHTFVSIHDIYKWANYGGDPHEPTAEGKVVFAFLERQAFSPCNVFVISGLHKPDLLKAVSNSLEPICCSKDRIKGPFDKPSANPTIWF